jgi:hypothetical protein
MDVRDARAEKRVARDASGRTRRKMTVSTALQWAWGDELPKMPADFGAAGAALRAGNAWNSILAFGSLGTVVDRQPNRFGCIPFDQAGWPHPDALEIAHAVERLAECVVDVPQDWHPMPEIAVIDAGLGARAVGEALEKATEPGEDGLRFRTRPDLLVVRHAILGTVPDWRLYETPETKFEAHANGAPKWFVRRETRMVIGEEADGSDRVDVVTVEADGWSARLRRPVSGAYRKPYLDPDPVPVIVARAEYEIFAAAMFMLFDDLDDRLGTIDLVPIDWPVQPWSGDSARMAEGGRMPKILPDLSALRAQLAAADMVTKSTPKRARKKAAKTA